MTASALAHPPASTPIVEMTGISIEFPGVKALQDVDFRLLPGEVHALMGENGAGKSTLIKALTGIYGIDRGTIVVDGRQVQFSSPEQARQAGVSTVYQEVNLCENLTVAENVMLGQESRLGPAINWRSTRRAAEGHLKRMGLDIDPSSRLGSHSLAIQQLVAICRATAIDCKVLVLDEPTSSLDIDEVQQLFGVMRTLRDQGVAILFVSHFLDQIYDISDRLTVLRNGQLIGEYLTSELSQHQLVSKMIGHSLEALGDLRVGSGRNLPESGKEPLVSAIGLSRKGTIEPFDLELYEGEVVGVAGLLGSGRTELARLLCGADAATAGELRVQGRPSRFGGPRAALDSHIAYSSEDRKAEGIVGDLTVKENIILAIQAERGWLRKLPDKQANEIVDRYIKALGIRPPNPNALIRNLSGGNQQKVLLARWLATQPQLLLLDEPTRGIDVGAKAEIQKLVADLAERGMSVVFISAELEEVLRLSNRIAVMRDRRKITELDNDGELQLNDVVNHIAGGER
ncbi:sugar ABC transporter ATP-binding protein [Tessaracoccus flavus]|uniref:Sugar ABC transporter ATP-binding protein n=1 Tax=Tessaracoccus flavus TaxID=1610493 RepID=A0A1Q2CBZ1_9ACTN|nr:sugar ABC transporter ATP-binding protein [Tessaracoccus flavus]AQP43621.1 sugar ABC transporter ATP-binding protein [Tessaracoccus flavus]SDZ01054.1 monosaccharide ABC transporter ATP-binding protein, CUT2 family [Tessaracoccus flavus]